MHSMKFRLLMLLLLITMVGCSSGGDDTPTTPTVPDTAAEFTTRGWQYFESDHFSEAVADFNSALELVPG